MRKTTRPSLVRGGGVGAMAVEFLTVMVLIMIGPAHGAKAAAPRIVLEERKLKMQQHSHSHPHHLCLSSDDVCELKPPPTNPPPPPPPSPRRKAMAPSPDQTPCYTALVAKNAKQAADMYKVLQVEQLAGAQSKGFGLFPSEFLLRHGIHLVLGGHHLYSQNLFQKEILSAIRWIPSAGTMSTLEEAFHIALCSTVPAYWFTVFPMDRIGRFTIDGCWPSSSCSQSHYWTTQLHLLLLQDLPGDGGDIPGELRLRRKWQQII